MRQSQTLKINNGISNFAKRSKRLLNSVGLLSLIVFSSSAMALAPNPGAVCNSGFSQGSLTNADYNSLFAQLNTNNYVDIAGNASGSIPLQVRMTTSESNGPPTSGTFEVDTVGGNSAFNLVRDFPSVTSVTSVDFDFRNSITTQPIFLTNVAMSALDIDYVSNDANSFDDYVLFTGVTASGNTIDGTFQSLQASGSNIRAFRDLRPTTPGLGLYTVAANGNECSGTNLDTECQGSVQFSEPVRSVKARYSSANFRIALQNPTNQQIFLRLDNYCYVPEYIFSGTVFNDNGGIPDAQADVTNANITSGAYNNTNYFNGVLNAPPETGITGSTVRLANCANTSTIYPTQSVLRAGAGTGEYQISIPRTTLANNTNLCLVETRSGATFPIRTSTESRNINFAATTFNYPNNNFGRVIAANAALVLKKFQFINACPTTLNYSGTSTTADPRTGFSTSNIANENIIPGQCIAYRITATNRANTPITNFIMQDKLQSKSDGAAVTSVLANPVASTTDYASDSVPIGQNGTVKTNTFTLAPRSNRDFYFNTKYGTVSGAP